MKILLADDSALLRGIIRELLSEEDDLEIVCEVTNGAVAYEKTRELQPDLVIMDVNMPVMDGIEASKLIMRQNPTPILVFTSEVDAEKGFEAIENGAIEIVKKPPIDQLSDEVFAGIFINKIRTLAKSRPHAKTTTPEISVPVPERIRKFSLVVIGASTGGPLAVRTVLSALQPDFPSGIAIVQHLESGFDQGYAEWLNEAADIPVGLAHKQGSFAPGTAVVAPADFHIRCTDQGYVLDQGEKVLNQRPSVDVLFSTAAEVYGRNVLGILLTGMGRDGADGCAAIKANNGLTICQDEATSAIFGMPKAAIELNAAGKVLSLKEIGLFLRRLSVKDK
jgi:two-component system chemotaxis response regulator CheB